MGLDEMTGSPNLAIVPDPSTFRVLPWAPGVGWVLCDEYFNERRAVSFLAAAFAAQAARAACRAGAWAASWAWKIEWYLLRVADDRLSPASSTGLPGVARAPDRAPAGRARLFLPLRIQHGPDAAGALRACDAFEEIGLPLRSIENEWGPGSGRMHLRAAAALEAADDALLFRTATRQICRRMGFFATFMCRPALKGYLFERLASAPVAGRREERAQSVHAGGADANVCRRSAEPFWAA